MLRIECWETMGGWWLVAQEIIVEPDKPSQRTRLGHVSWPDESGRKLTGLELLATVAEQALDLAYGQVDPRRGGLDGGIAINSEE
jgi:hypothetical protein